MKAFRKMFAILMTLAIVLSMATVAFADGFKIQLSTNGNAVVTGHIYTLYQIFTGDLVTEGEGELAKEVLSNIKYGTAGVGPTGDAVPEEVLASITNARTYAESLDISKLTPFQIADGEGNMQDAVLNESNEWTLTDIPAGYYLIVDNTEELPEGHTYSQYIVQVVSDVTMAPKSDRVPVEKMVSDDRGGLNCEETHAHTKACYNWEVANQVAIGDTVHFKIESAVPASAADYDYFYFYMEDKLSDGLDFTSDSVKVFAGEDELETTEYTLDGTGTDTYTFRVALKAAKDYAGKTIYITYDAVLNNEAVVGSSGNLNTADIKYSNDPNHKYNGSDTGIPAEGSQDPLGETPKKETKTFTTELKIYKVDQDGKKLTGAEFTLKGNGMNVVLIKEDKFELDVNGAYWKLTDDTYTTQEPVTEQKMEPAAADAEAGYVVAEDDYSGTDTVTVGGVAYRPYNKNQDSEKDVFILIQPNTDKYVSGEKYTKKSVYKSEQTAAAPDYEVAAFVNGDGVVVFSGLSKGQYTITETVTPAGYNTIAPFNFTIDCELPATAEGNCTWSVSAPTDSDVKYVEVDNAFEVTIVNKHGTVLPETGGMGTTIFYIVGSLMVVGAGVLLVTKKRVQG